MIFDVDDITVIHTELLFSTQFNFWQKLFSEKSKQFDESFTDVNYKNVDPITCKEVGNGFNKLNDRAPGLDMIKKSLIC